MINTLLRPGLLNVFNANDKLEKMNRALISFINSLQLPRRDVNYVIHKNYYRPVENVHFKTIYRSHKSPLTKRC